MSTLTGLISAGGGGGGGTPINGIAKLNVDDDIYTDENDQVWIRSGKILTTGLASYPDAEVKNDLTSLAFQLSDLYTLSSPASSIAQGFAFSPNGLNFYYLQWSNVIVRMQLAEAYNLHSVTRKTQSSNIGQGTDTAGFDISPDGTTLIICSSTSLKTYTLSTAFDTTNMTNVRNYAIGATGHGCRFADSGNKIFVAVGASGVKEFDLSTAYDTSTISNSGYTYSNGDTINDITWKEDGSRFYLAATSGYIYAYDVSVNFSFSGTETGAGNKASIVPGAWSRTIWLIPDNTGTKMMVHSYDNDNQIRTWRMSTAYSISTATYSTVPSFPAFATATGITFSASHRVIYSYDGTKAFAWEASQGYAILYEFTLSTAFDLSSATYDNRSLQIGSGDYTAGFYKLQWTNDGNNLCLIYTSYSDSYKGKIWKATTPYSLSGMSYSANYQATTTLYGLTIVNNGYQTYIAKGNVTEVYANSQYNPTSGYLMPNYLDFPVTFPSQNGFSFSNDGKYFFYAGFQYLTKTAYQLSVVSPVGYNSNFLSSLVVEYDGYYGDGGAYLYKKNNYIGFFSEDPNEFMRIK